MKEDILLIHKDPKSLIREAFRTIRTNIQFSGIDKTLKSLVVTSSISEEGKTTISINIAYSIAQTDKRVILIDCDLRKPNIHKVFDLPNLSGLTTALAGDIDYKHFVNTNAEDKLNVLTSGPIPPNPSELLGSKRMELLLEKVREDYDMIILDSPPVGIVTDAAVLSTIVDGTILVCGVDKTKIDEIKAAKVALHKVNANIIGVIMNKVSIKESTYYC